jgi:hypothetical protein
MRMPGHDCHFYTPSFSVLRAYLHADMSLITSAVAMASLAIQGIGNTRRKYLHY